LDAIEDRTREVVTHPFWDNPGEIISGAAHSYRENLWDGQLYRPEVWIEKDALLGVIEGVCREYRVPYFATRGNASATLVYEAGKRFARYRDQGLIPVVLHLADHDPNGIDMTRDLKERLKRYARYKIEVRRIALTMEQVEQYQPPPNFVKEADARTGSYRDQFGTDECWELDALSPDVIADLIRTEVEGLIEAKAGKRAQAGEKRGTKLLTAVAENWSEVTKTLTRAPAMKKKPPRWEKGRAHLCSLATPLQAQRIWSKSEEEMREALPSTPGKGRRQGLRAERNLNDDEIIRPTRIGQRWFQAQAEG
jgi:hypothetical protein